MVDELCAFLQQEFLLSQEEFKTLKDSPDQMRLLQSKLDTLVTTRKLQLLEYEWTLLPIERIRITVVTDTGHREFGAET